MKNYTKIILAAYALLLACVFYGIVSEVVKRHDRGNVYIKWVYSKNGIEYKNLTPVSPGIFDDLPTCVPSGDSLKFEILWGAIFGIIAVIPAIIISLIFGFIFTYKQCQRFSPIESLKSKMEHRIYISALAVNLILFCYWLSVNIIFVHRIEKIENIISDGLFCMIMIWVIYRAYLYSKYGKTAFKVIINRPN